MPSEAGPQLLPWYGLPSSWLICGTSSERSAGSAAAALGQSAPRRTTRPNHHPARTASYPSRAADPPGPRRPIEGIPVGGQPAYGAKLPRWGGLLGENQGHDERAEDRRAGGWGQDGRLTD